MTLAVIVQARMGSSRCPGKVMKPLGDAPFLKRCLDRCALIPGAGVVVCAIPDTRADDEMAALVASWGYTVARGSETDVLSRYATAARQVSAHAVMRVTSDCPFIDPKICGQTIDLWRESGADYGCNNMPPGFPHGLDCEVFHADWLYQAEANASAAYEREHVTPWIRTNPALKKSSLKGPGGGLEQLRWTLDYPEDVEMFQAVYAAMGEAAPLASAADYAALCLRQPSIPAINANRIDPGRLAATQTCDIERPVTAWRSAA